MLLVQVIVGGLLLGAIYALFSSGLTLMGNDEFHQFRPWRVRDARHVCDPARCCVAWRRPSDVWFCRRVHPLRAWGRGLSFANSLCAARAYAGANTFDV